MRIGQGFDVHAFDPSRPLVLGGVRIPGAPGLAGHSDADVLAHAVVDAILGAAALGDIGTHFPDTDPQWAGAGSLGLLREATRMVREAGHEIANVDATLLLEAPKVAPFIDQMRRNLAESLSVPVEAVSVKATRAEGLGALGRREGAACLAVALLV